MIIHIYGVCPEPDPPSDLSVLLQKLMMTMLVSFLSHWLLNFFLLFLPFPRPK